MKHYLKKLIGTLLTLAMIISVFPNVVYAEAANGTDNNTFNNAADLSSTQPVKGNLTSDDDVDFYKYTVDVSGYYNFNFTNTSAKESSWVLTVYDPSLKELERVICDDFSYASKVYNFKKGTVVYFSVKNAYDALNKDYSVTVNAKNDSNWEQESNDTKASATILSPKTATHGNIYSSDDVDYYKYTVDVTGTQEFKFSNLSAEEGSWVITVYDSSSLKDLEYVICDDFSYTSRKYNFKKGTILYLKVKNSYGAENKEYSVAVNAEDNSSWEQEKDDSFGTADTLDNNTVKHGNLYSDKDVDYYKFPAAKTGTLKINFTTDGDDIGNGWIVNVYDSSKKNIKRVFIDSANQTIKFKTQKGKQYYAKIEAGGCVIPINITYALKIK